ncbi:MAG TPA: hypothetical protein DD666_00660 [Advenella kashmirensis]|uniref:Uncharacterized protein n=1 Tax=Advenella kashmirensis TaxID=310575 RepID=A0A356LA70_9BURK|nr:hypothetical protein [Advenella kashmirensis]
MDKEETATKFTKWANSKAGNLKGQSEEATIKYRYAKFYRKIGGSIVVHEEEIDNGEAALDEIFDKAWSWPDMKYVAIKGGGLVRVDIHYPKGKI